MRHHAFVATSYHQHAISRLKFATCLLVTLVTILGCVPLDREYVIRSPLPVVTPSKNAPNVPIALLKVMSVPQEATKGAEEFLVSFPDEVMVDVGQFVEYRPSPLLIPVTDILLIGLRYAGLTVESYSTLNAAKEAGAHIAIVAALTTSGLRMTKLEGYVYSDEGEAVAELSVAFIDLKASELLSTALLKANAPHKNVVHLPTRNFLLGAATTSGSIAHERRLHLARGLMVQTYFNLSVELASRLNNVLSKRDH